MENSWFDVHYFDVLNGGSGVERMELWKIPQWLDEHKGVLIRQLVDVGPGSLR